jgi:hypothetical protein
LNGTIFTLDEKPKEDFFNTPSVSLFATLSFCPAVPTGKIREGVFMEESAV